MNAQLEQRTLQRTVALCQVLDLENSFLGITFNLTRERICLSLINTFSSKTDFFVILKPTHSESIPEIIIKIQPIWQRRNNSQYNEIGGKILQVWPENAFNLLLSFYDNNNLGELFW